MLQINLDQREVAAIETLLDEIEEHYEGTEDPKFLLDAGLYAHRLPESLRKGILHFKLKEEHPVCRVSGFRIDDAALGPTPDHWRNAHFSAESSRGDLYLQLVSHLLGETVAWATEQGGHMVHQVLPIAGNDGGQLGTSTDQLYWHTEDAFHPERMDYVALLCMRNNDKVATTYAGANDLNLDEETRAELFRSAYPFQPDEGNRADRELSPEDTGLVAEIISRSHERVMHMYESPSRVPALFGAEHDPYIRVHPHYIADFGDDAPASRAFERLKEAVNSSLQDIVLEPGDLFFIDNFKAVHGRREIPGHFDGTDRWLKRSFIVRDLRKTRELRVAAADRVVY